MKAIFIIIFIILALILAGSLISVIERRMLSVSSYEYSPTRGIDLKNKRIAVISDLHCCCFGDNNERLIDRILSLKPDILVIAGDMVTGTKTKNFHIPLDFLKNISRHVRVYYGYGNHERKAQLYLEDDPYFKEIGNIEGLTLLRNKSIIPFDDVELRLVGFDEELDFYKRNAVLTGTDIENSLGKHETTKVDFMIAHDPEQFEAYVQWGADLVVAGHLHGGIMRLPFLGGVVSPRYRFFPKYDAGRFVKEGTTMFVSRGLGNHGVPFRIFNRPEIMIIDFR